MEQLKVSEENARRGAWVHIQSPRAMQLAAALLTVTALALRFLELPAPDGRTSTSVQMEGLRHQWLAAVLAAFALVLGLASHVDCRMLQSWHHAGGTLVPSVRTLAPCIAFMFTGPCLVLINKYIMQDLGFHYPMCLGGLGQLFTGLTSRALVARRVAEVRPESKEVVAGQRWYFTVLPIAFCKAATIAFHNYAFLHLSLGFIQMLKAFTPAIVLCVTMVFGVAKPSCAGSAFVFLIVMGTMVEVRGDLKATPIGLAFMFVSEFAEAVSVVLTQKLLQNSKFTVTEGLYFLALPCFYLLLVFGAILEVPHMLQNGHHRLLQTHMVWFLASGSLGIVANYLSFVVVQVTSSVTLKILNCARSTGLVVVSILAFGEVATLMELVGYSIALVGFVGYNVVQTQPEVGARIERWSRALFCSTSQAARSDELRSDCEAFDTYDGPTSPKHSSLQGNMKLTASVSEES